MTKFKGNLPDGMQDILFKDCFNYKILEEKFRKVFYSMGFLEIMSPTLEFYEIFTEEKKSLSMEKMYKLIDNRGRILVLRPDITLPIARIASTKLKGYEYPLRLFYNSSIFRFNENFDGRIAETYQSGIEIIGKGGITADSEALIAAIYTIKEAKISDFTIEIGHADFFNGILEGLKLSFEEEEELRNIIEKKNHTEIESFLEERRIRLKDKDINLIKSMPRMFGGIEVVEEAILKDLNQKSKEALNYLKKIYEAVKAAGIEKYISFDLGIVQDLNYYTGIIFKGYSRYLGYPLLSGGRYDSLIDCLPAVGFGININRVVDTLKVMDSEESLRKPDYIIFYNEKYIKDAYSVSEKLRKKGYIVEISLNDNEDEALSYCRVREASFLISFDENLILKEFSLKENKLRKYSIIDFLNRRDKSAEDCNK